MINAYVSPRNPAEAILIRMHSAKPYFTAIIGLIGALFSSLLLLGLIWNRRTEMVAIPLDGEGRNLLLPERELRKKMRVRVFIFVAAAVIVFAVWGHFEMVAEVREGWTWLFSAALVAGLAALASMAIAAWQTGSSVSDARLIVRPAPARPGRNLEVQVEFDALRPLVIRHLTLTLECMEHYREKEKGRGNRSTEAVRQLASKQLLLEVPETVNQGEVICGAGQLSIDGSLPSTSSAEILPYIKWQIRVMLDLPGSADYQGIFPITVEREIL